jgi:hypothetical protein
LPESELGLIDRPLFERNGLRIDAYRFETLDPFLDLATRVTVVKNKGEAPADATPKASRRLGARESSKASELVGQRRTIPRFDPDSDLERAPRRRSTKLLRVHRREIDRQRRLVRKAEIDQSRMSDAVDAFSSLFGDDHFITLLRAEAISTMPWPLAEQMRGRSWL